MATYPHQEPAIYSSGERTLRPLGLVIRELPGQYLRIVTNPSVKTFAGELVKADWRSVWFQLLGWGFITALIGFIAWLTEPFTLTILNFIPGMRPETVQALLPRWPYGGQIFSVPLSFFTWMGMLYLMSRLFNGQGTFLEQCYASVLFLVPMGILSSLLALIPYLGSWLNFALFIYGIVLQVYAFIAAHRVSRGKATAAVFLPGLLIAALVLVFILVFAGVLIGTLLS